MALCHRCKRFDLHTILHASSESWPESSGRESDYYWHEQAEVLCFRHYNNILKVRHSASAGCKLCGIISAAFERKGAEADEIAGNFPIFLHEGLGSKIKASFISPEEGLITLCNLDMSISNSFDIPVDLPFSPFRQIHRDPGSSTCTALAAAWLHTCVENHDCAASVTPDLRSTTRFLHVGDKRRSPFLAEFAPGHQPKQWVALSYCWGKDHSQKLTASSVKRLNRGIAVDDFDATVRDAILTTRVLGIEHIWIDALCIFQDEGRIDLRKEASKMRDIYENSTITLVPVDSKSVTQGFLKERDMHYIPIAWRARGELHESSQHGSHQQVYLSESWNLKNDSIDGPWTKRGWTLQEGLLPNRLLFYSSSQMVWKCCKQIQYERGAGSEPLVEVVRGIFDEGGRDFWSFDLFTKFKLLPWFLEGPACHVRHERYRVWYDLVEDYSPRQLKHFQDRLIAVSGVAAKYADVIGDDQYFAGLWKADMVRGLLWRVPKAKLFDAEASDQSSSAGCNAPSWSWASVAPGFVVRNDYASFLDFRELATIEDVKVELDDPSNPFGAVSGGSVTMSGPTFQFSKLYNEDWRSPAEPLSAFERHISNIVEDDYSQRANEFSRKGQYAALLMLHYWPSFDNRVDVLILEAARLNANTRSSTFKRVGVITLGYIAEHLKASAELLVLHEKARNSLKNRLNPGRGPRRVKRIHCREVIQELNDKPWPCQIMKIV